MKYRVTFKGRKAGAIGIFYPISIVVEADDPEAAKLKAYDEHEHCHGMVCKPVPDTEEEA